jgi:DNA invertase Pin-like site-specific DNA recombinase
MDTTENSKRALVYIRLSTEEQLKGDGKRRQVEGATKCANERELEPVWEFEGERFEDIGKSALTGEHIKRGRFGAFFKAVKAGKMRGWTLITESLDRISRQDILDSLPMLIEIWKGDVTVVTACDGQVYSRQNAGSNFMTVMGSGLILSRGNEESNTKLYRQRRSWGEKRKNGAQKPLTALCPGWLRLMPLLQSNQRRMDVESWFEPIPEREKTVKRIYQECIDGVGQYSIARRLNRDNIKPFGGSVDGWHGSSVAKILSNEAVLGKYQAYRTVKEERVINGELRLVKKRIKDGEPIPNYFKDKKGNLIKIIDEDLFNRAQNARRNEHKFGPQGTGGRRGSREGEGGERLSNLFMGLATCAYCGSKMHYIAKGKPPKGGDYLVCDGARREVTDCERTGWRYDQFEKAFLYYVDRVDLNSILQSDDERATEKRELAESIQADKGAIAGMEAEQRELIQTRNDMGRDSKVLTQELLRLEQSIAQRTDDMNAKQTKLDKMQDEDRAIAKVKDGFNENVRRLLDRKNSRNFMLRTRVHSDIRALISRILVAPFRDGPDANAGRNRFFVVEFKDDTLHIYRQSEKPEQDDWNALLFRYTDGSVELIDVKSGGQLLAPLNPDLNVRQVGIVRGKMGPSESEFFGGFTQAAVAPDSAQKN